MIDGGGGGEDECDDTSSDGDDSGHSGCNEGGDYHGRGFNKGLYWRV